VVDKQKPRDRWDRDRHEEESWKVT
jgi:hypothetical protein